MKIFLDTADVYAIKDYFETGLIDGVTTNPTLIMKSHRDPDTVYQQIKDIGVPDISMEVMGNMTEMLEEGRRLSEKFGDVATIKLPMTKLVCKFAKHSLRMVSKQMSRSSSLLLRQFLLLRLVLLMSARSWEDSMTNPSQD